MTLADAQREIRITYLNGAVGSFVSAILWLAGAALGTWATPRSAMITMVLGGMVLFPVSQLVLKALGRRSIVSRGNPLPALAMQAAFIIPLTLPVVGGATLHRLDWFFPALLIVVGAHYLPFITLYGLRHYAVIAGALIGGGLMLGLYGPRIFAAGGWLGAIVLLAFAAWLAATREPVAPDRTSA
jgi:hypothetical protein